MFRQIIFKLLNYELKYEDYEFTSLLDETELLCYSLPILPIIKKYLELELPDYIYVFGLNDSKKRLYMDIYDYYYIRLLPDNFKNYLDILKK